MLPDHLRCRNRAWFAIAHQQPKLAANKTMALIGIPMEAVNNGNETEDTALSPPKLGVVISKKVAKQAVKRNKLRRQIHEIYRQELADQWHTSPLLSQSPQLAAIIIIVRQQAAHADYQQIRAAFYQGLQLCPV